jgi:hypothetical protein
MTHRLTKWLTGKWRLQEPEALRRSYQVTFSTLHGQQVLQHLMDSVYCTVYEGTDPHAAAVLNARRSVVHEILMNIDLAENPDKYRMEVSHG